MLGFSLDFHLPIAEHDLFLNLKQDTWFLSFYRDNDILSFALGLKFSPKRSFYLKLGIMTLVLEFGTI